MQTIIRTSDRNYFKRCRELWNFTSKIRENWEPIQRYRAFDFGTAIHAGLEAYYDPALWNDTQPVKNERARQAFKDSMKELQSLVRVGDVEIEMGFAEEMTTGLAMLDQYFSWAPKHDNWEPRFTEVEFEIECEVFETYLDESGVYRSAMLMPFLYQGRIDLVVEDEYGYWIIDHKTAKQFSDVQWLWLDDQCGSYAWAIQEKLGLEVRGVIYNQLRKSPPHPPRMLKSGAFSVAKNQDTSFEVYLRTLREHGIDPHYYRDFLLYLKQNPKEYVRRTKVNYTQKKLELIGKRIQKEAKEMINDPAIYPTPSQMNCNGCRFFAPCVAKQEGSDYETILHENYIRRSA